MAYRNPFNPRGTDYRGAQDSMDRAQRDLTSALDAKGKADKQARIKKSGERSGMEKLLSAAGRAGIAYATGGASEALGFGGAVDDIMLGTDSEGNSVRNEYGDLVGAGAKVYGAMDAKKTSDIAGKRASNIRDFKEQVSLAEKMGVLDKKQGRDMMLDAMDLRSRQQAQTKAADEKGTWGWDNTFDDLALSPAQIRGKEIAQEKQVADAAKQERMLGSEDRRQGGQLAGYKDLKEIQDLKERRTSAREEASRSGLEELGRQRLSSREADRFSREGVLNEQTLADSKAVRENAIKSLPNRKPDIWMASQDRPTESKTGDRLIKQMAVDDMMDSEYNKKYGTGEGDHKGRSLEELKSNVLGKRQNQYERLKFLAGNPESMGDPAETGSFLDKILPGRGKSTIKYKQDTEEDSGLEVAGREADRINNIKRIKNQPWYKIRSDEDKQRLLEDRLLREQALKEEHTRTGGPMGKGDYKGSLYNPYKNPSRLKELRRAREIAIKKGGILAQ